ncbi:MAG: hypothetical protein JWM57_2685 [Phycisphaerales bacterium]|nr:hypothetical protein [Phycisphaerales bacterium]
MNYREPTAIRRQPQPKRTRPHNIRVGIDRMSRNEHRAFNNVRGEPMFVWDEDCADRVPVGGLCMFKIGAEILIGRRVDSGQCLSPHVHNGVRFDLVARAAPRHSK